MAIIVEEEQGNRVSIISALMWVLVLVIIIAAGYFIFFAQPQFVEIVAPQNFKGIDPLANLNLDPEGVVQSQEFQSLRQYVTPIAPGNAGKSNPFGP